VNKTGQILTYQQMD